MKRKAINPLIATILLIGLTITASVFTYAWTMGFLTNTRTQSETQMRIDYLDWGEPPHTTIDICVRNTGTVAIIISTVEMKENKELTPSVTLIPDPANARAVEAGRSLVLKYSLPAPSLSTMYVFKVTVATGFFDELVVLSPVS